MLYKGKSRGWCFTINNDVWSDLMDILSMNFRYLIIGFEIGEEGTPHIQGYVLFHSPLSGPTVQRKMPRAHVEPSRGSVKQASEYCAKDGDFYEFGERPHQGGASWEKIEEAMADPSSNPHLFNQYKKTYDYVTRSDLNKSRKEYPKELILCVSSRQYEYLKQYDSVYKVQDMLETYEDEDIICMSAYSHNTWVMDWLNGYPTKIRRGYEVIVVNPLKLVITFQDLKEYSYLKNLYLDYITDVVQAKEI